MTSAGEIRMVTFRDLAQMIAREDVRYIASEAAICRQNYMSNMLSSSPNFHGEIMSYHKESYHLRECSINLSSAVKFLEERIRYYIERGEIPVIMSKNNSFVTAVEGSAIQILEQFGLPEHIIQLSSSSYLVGDFKSDNIKLFQNIEEQLAEVVFLSPSKFCVLSLNNEATKDALKFLAVDTFGRLAR